VVSLARHRHPFLDDLGVTQVVGDVSDGEAVKRAAAGVDGVIHVAAKVGMGVDRRPFYRTNVDGTRNVIEACGFHRIQRLVYTSTPSVIFDATPHGGVDETRPYPARFYAPYPETKARAEREVLAADGDRLRTCAIRPHLIWGPRDPHLIPGVVEAIRRGRMRIVGDGTNVVDTVYVENAADAHIAALDRLIPGSPVCGQAYFISQGAPVNLWAFLDTVMERIGEPKPSGRVSLRAAYGAGAILEKLWWILGREEDPPMTRFVAMNLAYDHWFVIDKAKRDLGYTVAVSTEEGLDRLAVEWKKRGG
jgi:nucleoside-diphosphate-sugar epimerase